MPSGQPVLVIGPQLNRLDMVSTHAALGSLYLLLFPSPPPSLSLSNPLSPSTSLSFSIHPLSLSISPPSISPCISIPLSLHLKVTRAHYRGKIIHIPVCVSARDLNMIKILTRHYTVINKASAWQYHTLRYLNTTQCTFNLIHELFINYRDQVIY